MKTEKSSLDSMQTNIYDNANAGTTLLLLNPKSACNNNGSKRQQAGSKPSVPTTSNSKTKQSPSLINSELIISKCISNIFSIVFRFFIQSKTTRT